MSTGLRRAKLIGALLLGASVLCMGKPSQASDRPTHSQRKTKKVPAPPLPSGPTGPVQQIPLDSMAAVPPQVNFQNNQLTIVAPNSTLADILRAVRKQTGAEIEIPVAPERVVTRLGPGPAREVVADLLNGSRFNYVLLGSAADQAQLTRVVLVAKSAPEATPAPLQSSPGITQANIVPPDEDTQPDASDAQTAEEDNPDENPDQAVVPAEQQPNADQAGVKTPQQMLQEMQQRQMQMQQQQPAGQPPIPGAGMPPHPPPDQPQQQ
jgi:hypothetical protein